MRLLSADVGGGCAGNFSRARRRGARHEAREIRTKCGVPRTKCVSDRDLMSASPSSCAGRDEKTSADAGRRRCKLAAHDGEVCQASATRRFALRDLFPQAGRGEDLQACRLASPSLALTSAILARLTGTRCGDGPSSSITAPSPSLRTKLTWGIATIWLRCTRTNRPGSSCASASEIDHGHIRSRVPSCTLV